MTKEKHIIEAGEDEIKAQVEGTTGVKRKTCKTRSGAGRLLKSYMGRSHFGNRPQICIAGPKRVRQMLDDAVYPLLQHFRHCDEHHPPKLPNSAVHR